MDGADPTSRRLSSPAPSEKMRIANSIHLDHRAQEQLKDAPNLDITFDVISDDEQPQTTADRNADAAITGMRMVQAADVPKSTGRRVQWDIPDRPQDAISIESHHIEEPQRPVLEELTDSKAKHILAYLAKVGKLSDEMREQRRNVAIRRTERDHHEATLVSRGEHVRDSINVVSRILLGDPDDIAVDTLHQFGSRLDSDFEAFEEQSRLTASFREEVNKSRVDMQNIEDKVYDSIARLKDSLLDLTEDDLSSDAGSQEDSTVSQPPREVIPREVYTYHSKIGDYRIVYERLVDVELDHRDELAERQHFADQDKPYTADEIRDSELMYALAKDEASAAVERAETEVEAARRACFAANINPDEYTHVLFNDPQEDSGEGTAKEKAQIYDVGPIDVMRTEVVSTAGDEDDIDSSAPTSEVGSVPTHPKQTMPRRQNTASPVVEAWLARLDQQGSNPNSKKTVNADVTGAQPSTKRMDRSTSPSPNRLYTEEQAASIAKAAAAQIIAVLAE